MSALVDTAEEAAPAVVFKKKSKSSSAATLRRPIAQSTPMNGTDADDRGEGTSRGASAALDETTGDDADREGTPSNLSELIALRKLRQSIRKSGTDVEKVNAATGDAAAAKRRKRKAAEDSAPGYGLQASGSKDAGDSDDDESNAITRKIMKTDNFTHQTGIVDVDKHMLAYIEKELKKRRGQESGEFDAEKEMQNLDPRDELFRVAEKYRIKRDHLQEGSVATSAAMLTAIPEVDLGIDIRLKNIEATEIAKRKLLEVREKTKASGSGATGQLAEYNDASYAGARFFRHARGNQTDFDALRAAKIEAGIEEDSEDEKYEAEMKTYFEKEARNVGRGQMATDDLVAERFKRKGLLQTKGKGRR